MHRPRQAHQQVAEPLCPPIGCQELELHAGRSVTLHPAVHLPVDSDRLQHLLAQ